MSEEEQKYEPKVNEKTWPSFVDEWFKNMGERKEEDGEQSYECMDNFRAVNMTSPSKEDMLKYNEQKDKGCCGEKESTITGNGEIWRVGFNYGH
jgi:hypothetical protein